MIIIQQLSIKTIIIIYTLATLFFIGLLLSKKLNYNNAKASFFIYFNFTFFLFTFYFLQSKLNINHIFSILLIAFGIINLLILKIFKLSKKSYYILFAFLVGFAIKFSYISYTPFWLRQHDSKSIYNPKLGGHFGYIGFILMYGHIPNVNPTKYWCFYNPPLFHLISAGFIKFQLNFGIKLENCYENLQVLSLIYSFLFDFYLYRILKQLKIEKSIPIILLFVIVSPAMVIMSGSLNNDILSIALSCMALFYAIKWFETDKLLDLIKIAFCISFAMMTKINSAIIAIVIAILFIIKFIQNKKNYKKYLINFLIFAIIALPIGLWFPIRNLIKYNIPPTYVQSVEFDNPSNISNYSILDRLFKIELNRLKDINVNMTGKNIDYNLFITTLKSYILDENIDYSENNILRLCFTFYFLPLYYNFNIIFSKYYFSNN